MPHSAAMPGEAKLIDSTSKPSSALSAMVIADDDHLQSAHRRTGDHVSRISRRHCCPAFRRADALQAATNSSSTVACGGRVPLLGIIRNRAWIAGAKDSTRLAKIDFVVRSRGRPGQSITMGDNAARLVCVPDPGQNRNTSII